MVHSIALHLYVVSILPLDDWMDKFLQFVKQNRTELIKGSKAQVSFDSSS